MFSVDLEREGKAKRLQLHKCKIDQNDTTERWKDVQDIQRRKRIPREQIPTEIHREHTESIREDGMDITNDTWPFSLHQPPPHYTTRRIVVVSSSLFHSLFLLVPSHPSFKPNLFHHLFSTPFTTASSVHLAFVLASSVHSVFVPASSVLSSFVSPPLPRFIVNEGSTKEFHPSDGRTFIEGSHFHVALVSRQHDVRT